MGFSKYRYRRGELDSVSIAGLPAYGLHWWGKYAFSILMEIKRIRSKSGRLKCGNYFCAGPKGIGVLTAGVLIAVLIGCGARPVIVRQRRYEAVGLASYYGSKFHGRRTASGERYDMYDLTAAHPVLKFGSRVEVTNLKNGRKVRVRINDRGPFRKGRIIDLSYAAAKKIGMLTRGLVKVRVKLLNE
jgi:rare lipoprotein A